MNLANQARSHVAIPPNGQSEANCACIPAVRQTRLRWGRRYTCRLSSRVPLIVLKTLNAQPSNEPSAVTSLPICSNILCKELIQIVRHIEHTGFYGVIVPGFFDHDIMLLSLGLVQT